MQKVKIKIIKEDKELSLPFHESALAAGFDLEVHSFMKMFKGAKEVDMNEALQNSIKHGYIHMRPHERLLVGTGIRVQLPEDKQLEIRDRSGNALRKGLLVANSPGTIDADYTGEVGVILLNTSPFLVKVSLGDRIAQGIISNAYQVEWDEVDEFEETERGEDGFGSTDKK